MKWTMFACDLCRKDYAFTHQLQHYKIMNCKAYPRQTCMLRQEELFTPLLTPQQGEGEKEFGNGEKEGEEAREELVVGGRQRASVRSDQTR